MSLYTKDQLLDKSAEELNEIALALGVKSNSTDKEILVYEILDAQAVVKSSTESSRTMRSRRNTASEAKPAEIEAVNSEVEEIVLPKRKRGRPSKAEIAAREAAAAKLLAMQNAINEAVPVEQEEKTDTDASIEALPDFLAEQIEQQKAKVESESKAEENIPDLLSLKDSLNERMKLNTLGITYEEEEEVAKALDENPDTDFIILQDVPETLSGNFEYENTYGYEQENQIAARPRFRRFKDDLLNTSNDETPIEGPVASSSAYSAQDDSEPLNHEEEEMQTLPGRGILEIVNEGHGFLRSSDFNYLSSPDDIYVSPAQIYQYGLKTGDVVEGVVRIPSDRDTFFKLMEIEFINGRKPIEIRDRVAFEHLTPLFPEEKFNICSGHDDSMSCRIVDLFAPIGKGQRALIVAQPKTGKTMLMKDIANAIARNHPDTYLMMLLIDERPEEVTDMARTVNAEVIASTFDEPAARHVKIANIVLEKAKRMVESGHDVVIFLDSITRLARAYNTVAPASGKVLTGGVDANALQKPKRFFGAARNIEGGGSLTIIATALIDTGSKMDEVIFEEFKGTGNMELQLDRALANKRLFPSVNLLASSTRRDDLLQDATTLNRMWVLRNFIADMNPVEAITEVKKQLEGTRSNEEFLLAMSSNL